MNDDLYNKCFSLWEKYDKKTPFWEKLAQENGYKKEGLRSAFRRERKRRKIEKKNSGNNTPPTIVLLDIETSPLQVWSWGVYDQRIDPDFVIDDWFIISWSAKMLFSSTTASFILTQKEIKAKNDERIVKAMWELINSSDILITYNGDRFDIKRLNTRFVKWGLMPPSPYKHIDLYKTIKYSFDFTSNRMDYVNETLGISRKIKIDFKLWADCLAGNRESLAKMQEYNANDVQIMEDLYVRLRPWIKNHPNINIYNDVAESVCPNCGSTDLEENGFYYTPSGKYAALRCSECGALSRMKKNQIEKPKAKTIALGI